MKRSYFNTDILTILVLLFLTSCQPNQVATELSTIVEDYIRTYQERNDWEKLLSFYADSIYLNDIQLNSEFKGIDAFKSFYDWPNPNFKKLTPNQITFETEDVIVVPGKAIIKGSFNPFYWKGEIQDWAGPFVIWLYFNEENKIIKQYDYIKYPARFLE